MLTPDELKSIRERADATVHADEFPHNCQESDHVYCGSDLMALLSHIEELEAKLAARDAGPFSDANIQATLKALTPKL